uniref:Uncharacterized protein n=1 Tax=Pyramimonas orientalis virus TaxID=455367 RepID=A0A7M3UNY4_POV01|nr:hypothetical protein HWQ62_00295 [Pyramimonas orientalis virus]
MRKYIDEKVVVAVFMLGLLYNLFVFQNYLFIFVIVLILATLFYTNPKVLNKRANEKKQVNKIIETFDLREVLTNMYDIHKIPKQFKYIFVKTEILKNLIDLQFVYKFNKEVYTKIFIILEKFLKMFYNGITDRYDKKQIFESMKLLHEDMKRYSEELKLNVPIVSKNIRRFGKKNLHHVIEENMKAIIHFMTNKIVIMKALVEEKIK